MKNSQKGFIGIIPTIIIIAILISGGIYFFSISTKKDLPLLLPPAPISTSTPTPKPSFLPIQHSTRRQIPKSSPIPTSTTTPITNQCNMRPDSYGNCPAGCVNYGNPLGCVTKEYKDYCTWNPGKCPY